MRKVRKLVIVLREPAYRSALRLRVAAAIEHDRIPFACNYGSVIDVGAGRGQFALVARRRFPDATIYCFEPLDQARDKLTAVTRGLRNIRIHACALGSAAETAELNVSHKRDSSSLLPMTPLHVRAFPGTETKGGKTVSIARLDDVLSPEELVPPSLLKVDAQGYELHVLRGAEPLLSSFATVLVECSFVALYAGQALADEVTCFLRDRGFRLRGIYSIAQDDAGRCLQADMLFERERAPGPDAEAA